MNQITTLVPYAHNGGWAFTDEAAGLKHEAFVLGSDKIMGELSKDIPNADKGFQLIFSRDPFPGFQAKFNWSRKELAGNWYHWPEKNLEGWLCPALFSYFETAPKNIYVSAKPL